MFLKTDYTHIFFKRPKSTIATLEYLIFTEISGKYYVCSRSCLHWYPVLIFNLQRKVNCCQQTRPWEMIDKWELQWDLQRNSRLCCKARELKKNLMGTDALGQKRRTWFSEKCLVHCPFLSLIKDCSVNQSKLGSYCSRLWRYSHRKRYVSPGGKAQTDNWKSMQASYIGLWLWAQWRKLKLALR